MCAVCSPQAVTCGFNPLYEDRLPPLICSLSPHKLSMVSLYLSHQLHLGSPSYISGISLPFFYLANNFSYTVSPFLSLIESAPPKSLKHPPTGASWLSPLDFFLTTHCLKGVMLKTSFFFYCFVCLWIEWYPKGRGKTRGIHREWKFQMFRIFALKVCASVRFCGSMQLIILPKCEGDLVSCCWGC